jgi:hypothetical protein
MKEVLKKIEKWEKEIYKNSNFNDIKNVSEYRQKLFDHVGYVNIERVIANFTEMIWKINGDMLIIIEHHDEVDEVDKFNIMEKHIGKKLTMCVTSELFIFLDNKKEIKEND